MVYESIKSSSVKSEGERDGGSRRLTLCHGTIPVQVPVKVPQLEKLDTGRKSRICVGSVKAGKVSPVGSGRVRSGC